MKVFVVTEYDEGSENDQVLGVFASQSLAETFIQNRMEYKKPAINIAYESYCASLERQMLMAEAEMGVDRAHQFEPIKFSFEEFTSFYENAYTVFEFDLID